MLQFGRAKIAVIVFLGLVLGLGAAHGATNAPVHQTSAVSYELLDHELRARADRVPEFKFIKEQANRMGVRAFLFGGTASGFAHYVRWDLLRESGDSRFQPDRFDYDFTNIYRSNQDLDIVVDGTKEQIDEMQKILHATFPHFQGTKEAWEVRSLRENLGGTKIALLNSDDFLNQNTDSNSTGLVELTETESHTSHDLFNWNQYPSQYLLDIAEGKITYYRNPLHPTTDRYLQGKNPEIMSVVRYFIKVVQYELEMRPDDLGVIQQIINDFNPSANKDDYVKKKLEEIGKKLVQNAFNVEYAVNLIDRLGLKSKLISFSDPKIEGSMGWWLSRQALTTKPVGAGSGKTATELGITIVAHETGSFQAYESITRAHTGDPNVLISRGDTPGESAAHGDGFYTKIGTNGARGTGLTVRFRVDPKAREGTDFVFIREEKYVIFKNKAALRVIPESLRIGPVEFVKLLLSSEIKPADRGVFEKLKRRAGNQLLRLTEGERAELRQLALKEFREGKWSFPLQFLFPHFKSLGIGEEELADLSAIGRIAEGFPTNDPLVQDLVRLIVEAQKNPQSLSKLEAQLKNLGKWDKRNIEVLDYIIVASGLAKRLPDAYLGGPFTDLTWMKFLKLGDRYGHYNRMDNSITLKLILKEGLNFAAIAADPEAANWLKHEIVNQNDQEIAEVILQFWFKTSQAAEHPEIVTEFLQKTGKFPLDTSSPYWGKFFPYYLSYLEAHPSAHSDKAIEVSIQNAMEYNKLIVETPSMLRFLKLYYRSSSPAIVRNFIGRVIRCWYTTSAPYDPSYRAEYLRWLELNKRSPLGENLRKNIPIDDSEATAVLSQGMDYPRRELTKLARVALDGQVESKATTLSYIADFKYRQSAEILKRLIVKGIRDIDPASDFYILRRNIASALEELKKVGIREDAKALRASRAVLEAKTAASVAHHLDMFLKPLLNEIDTTISILEQRDVKVMKLPRPAPRCEALLAQ